MTDETPLTIGTPTASGSGGVSERDARWSDWRWQMTHRIETLAELRAWIDVTPREEAAIAACEARYRWSITPYYASLMHRTDDSCPIRRQAVPGPEETIAYPDASVDPVGDRHYRRTNRVVHKYPDRVMMLVTATCPVYCRHCTRKYHTTDLAGTYFGDTEGTSYEEDFAYIAAHPEIRDVLLSGGDPLIYSDARLEAIVSRLRGIPHVELIRIGTRVPVLLPFRVTTELCAMLERYHPIWVNTHFNHPREITPAAADACARLLHHGIPVQNQSVLLKGINDDLDVLRALLRGLLKIRVRPYYLYHCDNVLGVSQFMTTIEHGRKLMDGLIGHTTGFGVPQYVLTTEIGKIPLWEERCHQTEDGYQVENWEGRQLHVTRT